MALFGGVTIPGHPSLENIALLDRLPIPMIRKAARVGFAIDPPYFHELSSRFSAEMVGLEKDIASYIPPARLYEFHARATAIESEPDGAESGVGLNASSSEQIALLLFEMLGIGADKKLKRTNKGRVSTGKKQLELVRLDHPVIPLVLRQRELDKLVSNYCDKLPRMARLHPRSECCPVCELRHQTDQWRVHGEMGTTRADTGRINHKNPNLGNVPARTEDGQAVQAGFVAPPGYRLVNRDLSQIELRDLAHLSDCKSMIDTYARDGDIHTETCYLTKLAPPDRKPTVAERMGSKRCSFGIMNGSTEKGLFLQLVMDFGAKNEPMPEWLTEVWCKWFIEQWLDSRPEVREYIERQHYRARRYGMVWDPWGRVKLTPEVRSTHRWIRESGLRQAQNMPVTAMAAGQLKLAMGKVDALLTELRETGVWAFPILTIHDSIKVEAEEGAAEDVLELLGVAMDGCMDDEETGECRSRVPIKSDGGMSSRWGKE